VKRLARAKLNLRLDVLGLEPSGLHAIRSLIAELDLADDVEIVESDGPFSVTCEGADIPERENLAWLAATRLGVDLKGVQVHIRKNIPMQAGLGGGSADAAAVLRGLTDLLKQRGVTISDEQLRSAARVGSDVPACLAPGFKIVEGTGDVVRPVALEAPAWGMLLLRPPAGVPTAEAYRLLDAGRTKGAPPSTTTSLLELCKAIEAFDFPRTCALLYNDFQPVLEFVFPNVAEARRRLRSAGAAATLLCGSGSCVAGFFPTRAAAKAAFGALEVAEGEWATATGFSVA
jgi:4-diphosphocytidyl-2-C-methyl-D-erythritol kinase